MSKKAIYVRVCVNFVPSPDSEKNKIKKVCSPNVQKLVFKTIGTHLIRTERERERESQIDHELAIDSCSGQYKIPFNHARAIMLV